MLAIRCCARFMSAGTAVNFDIVLVHLGESELLPGAHVYNMRAVFALNTRNPERFRAWCLQSDVTA